MDALTPEQKKALKDFIFVDEKTHELLCFNCVDCNVLVERWFPREAVSDPHERLMELQTSQCSFCIDEERTEQEEDEELAELEEEAAERAQNEKALAALDRCKALIEKTLKDKGGE